MHYIEKDQIKVLEHSISYEKVSGRKCVSPARGKVGCFKYGHLKSRILYTVTFEFLSVCRVHDLYGRRLASAGDQPTNSLTRLRFLQHITQPSLISIYLRNRKFQS